MKRLLLLITILLPLTLPAQESAQDRMQKAKTAYFNGEIESAFNQYQQISKDTLDKEAFLNAAFTAMELGKRKEAQESISFAYQMYPSDRDILEFMGDAYLDNNEFDKAEKLFSYLIEDDGKKDLFFINLARAQAGMKAQELALRNLQIAALGTSLTSYSNYLLGSVYALQKDWPAAERAYQSAVNYDSQFSEARAKLAYAQEMQEKFNEAWRNYRAVSSADKANEEMKAAVERLTPKLTKTKKEILQPKQVDTHTLAAPVVSLDGVLPKIKIGLGAKSNGTPSERESITFIPSGDFQIFDTDTNLLVAAGQAKETWQAKIVKGKPYIVTAQNKNIAFKRSIIIRQKPTSATVAPTIILKEIMTGASMTWASEDDKEFRGEIEIAFNQTLKTLIPINHVNIEEYTFGVIASEMPTGFPVNALRAQAILARTYGIKRKGHHKNFGYDVCDTQHCQVYGGIQNETERGNAAVEATIGQALTYKGRPVEAVFSSNSGGMTQSSKSAGWAEHPYLTATNDYKKFDASNLQPYHFKQLLQHPQDAYSNYHKTISAAAWRWVRVVDEKYLSDTLKKTRQDIGSITSITVLQRNESGFVKKVKVTGTKGEVTLNGDSAVRYNLSLGMLRSNFFIVRPVYEGKTVKEFIFYGGGWGHAVGFCQTGAAGRAEAGQSFADILTHYYPGTELKDIRLKN